MAGVGLVAVVTAAVTTGWSGALVIVTAMALGLAAGRLYLYLTLRNRFDALAHLANEAVLVLDERYRVLYVSPSAEALFGLPLHRAVTIDPTGFVHPDDLDAVTRAARAVRSTPGGGCEVVFRVTHPTKGLRWLELSGTNLLDDPRVGGVVSTVRDVTDRVRAEEAVRASSERFHELVSNSADILLLCDEHAHATFASAAVAPSLGVQPDDVVGVDLVSFLHPADAERADHLFHEVVRQPGGSASFEVRALRADAHYIDVEVRLQNLLDNPAVGAVVVHARDITARRRAEADAHRFQSIIENTSDLVMVSGADGRPLFVNQAARRLMGIEPDADIAQIDPASLLTPTSWETVLAEGVPAAMADGVWSGEVELRRPTDGTVLPVSQVLLAHRSASGDVDFFASVSRDMSDQKTLEAQLQHQAAHDELTGLPGRKPLISYLEVMLANNRRFGGKVAALFIDVDRFKVVNDSLGHHAGDRLLRELARRLVSVTRPQDRAGRFGGDEFVVILPDIAGPQEVVEIADQVRHRLAGRYEVGSEEVYVTASVGVALAVGHERPEELLRDADAAMYEAKSRGRNRVQLFDGAMRLQVVERLDIEQALRRALERDELCLEFQPVVDITSGGVRGVEALVRWRHPDRGLLLPGQFLPVADETGLIVDLGRWVLRTACAEAVRWQPAAGGDAVPVYVNLSARQLADPELEAEVREVIDLTGLAPDALHLEITEDALMDDPAAATGMLHRLRALGVQLAIDDFGTGYSSLSYLKHFPVNVLKIDKTFVEGLGADDGDAAITAAIVDVAQRLGLRTIAEGVEDDGQARWLATLGCDYGQGYHFARPMSAEQLRRHLGVIDLR